MIFKKKQDAAVQQTAAGEAKPAAKGGKAAAFFRKNWKWMVPVVCVAVLGGWFILRPDKAQNANKDINYVQVSPSKRDVSNTLSGTGTLNPAVPVHGLDSASREKEEVRFREVFFSRIRLDQLGCDLRALWEPARLQDVAADLAGRSSSAFQVERDHCALQRALAWIDSNPFPFGLHYLSVMECGLRIPVFERAYAISVARLRLDK